jgi:hypothetical protein
VNSEEEISEDFCPNYVQEFKNSASGSGLAEISTGSKEYICRDQEERAQAGG